MLIFSLPKIIVIFDLECTAWPGSVKRNWAGPGEYRELVQIVAVLTETTKGFTELSNFKSLVKPRINPILSDYFIELTGITQEEINSEGIDKFPVVLQSFYNWSSNYELYCFDNESKGSQLFDRDVLIENCELYGIEFPFQSERFHNIQKIFRQHGYKIEQSGTTPEAFGIKILTQPHNALNDVRGLIIGLKALSERLE